MAKKKDIDIPEILDKTGDAMKVLAKILKPFF